MSTQIPGEPASSPYSETLDFNDLDNSQTKTNNFSEETLEENQVVGEEDHYLICDRTGFKIALAEGLRKEWNGRMVRKASWEARHPQDFLKPRAESERDGSPRPEPEDRAITDDYPNGVTPGDL